jgi:ABC-type amino acid transport substrate-binding protein
VEEAEVHATTKRRIGLAAVVAIALTSTLATAAGASRHTARRGVDVSQFNLISSGTLTVGMNLTSKPEMYLDSHNKPAGYDVVLLNKLAKTMGVKLKIVNLVDWTGLIPGLQAHKFDMVSSGLDATPERKKVLNFSRSYVPYQVALAVPAKSTLPATVDAWNKPGTVLTVDQGTIDQTAAQKVFPQATIKGLSSNPSAMLEVATGRANAAVLESFQIVAFMASNPNELKPLFFPKSILPVYYGAYAFPKGANALTQYINKWICANAKNGFMAKSYKQTEQSPFPGVPTNGC